jgi:hypothetical protein
MQRRKLHIASSRKALLIMGLDRIIEHIDLMKNRRLVHTKKAIAAQSCSAERTIRNTGCDR